MTSISELVKNFMSLDDKVAAIFFATGKSEITTNQQKLHSAFFELTKRYPSFFNEVHFKKGGRFPYSESLEQTFPGLAISGLLSCQNPEYNYYTMNKAQKKSIKNNIFSQFKKEEQEEIMNIATELISLL